MIIVVDTNRMIAALIKDSFSRKIISSPKLKLVCVNFGKKEIEKYKHEIIEKANITGEEFESLIAIILSKIDFISDLVIEEHIDKAKEIMDKIHRKV